MNGTEWNQGPQTLASGEVLHVLLQFATDHYGVLFLFGFFYKMIVLF